MLNDLEVRLDVRSYVEAAEMSLFRRRARRGAGDAGTSGADELLSDTRAAAPEPTIEDFEVPNSGPGEDCLCSDNDCPCGLPGATIPRGSGYMYVAESVVEWRRDARSVPEAEEKARRLQQQAGRAVVFGQDTVAPTLMCEQGARRRGLDLEVAAADARHWWATERVPLRATPLARSRS
jgi:hypothetical protein